MRACAARSRAAAMIQRFSRPVRYLWKAGSRRSRRCGRAPTAAPAASAARGDGRSPRSAASARAASGSASSCRPVRAEVAERRSARDAQVDARDGDPLAEALRQPLGLDDQLVAHEPAYGQPGHGASGGRMRSHSSLRRRRRRRRCGTAGRSAGWIQPVDPALGTGDVAAAQPVRAEAGRLRNRDAEWLLCDGLGARVDRDELPVAEVGPEVEAVQSREAWVAGDDAAGDRAAVATAPRLTTLKTVRPGATTVLDRRNRKSTRVTATGFGFGLGAAVALRRVGAAPSTEVLATTRAPAATNASRTGPRRAPTLSFRIGEIDSYAAERNLREGSARPRMPPSRPTARKRVPTFTFRQTTTERVTMKGAAGRTVAPSHGRREPVAAHHVEGGRKVGRAVDVEDGGQVAKERRPE